MLLTTIASWLMLVRGFGLLDFGHTGLELGKNAVTDGGMRSITVELLVID
jgi:hypothetical protein